MVNANDQISDVTALATNKLDGNGNLILSFPLNRLNVLGVISLEITLGTTDRLRSLATAADVTSGGTTSNKIVIANIKVNQIKKDDGSGVTDPIDVVDEPGGSDPPTTGGGTGSENPTDGELLRAVNVMIVGLLAHVIAQHL